MDASTLPAPGLPSILTKSPGDLQPEEILMLQRRIRMLTEHNRYLLSKAQNDTTQAYMQGQLQGQFQAEQRLGATYSNTFAMYQNDLNVQTHKVMDLKQRLHQATQQIYSCKQFIDRRLGKGAFDSINLTTKRACVVSASQVAESNKRRRLNIPDRNSTTVTVPSSQSNGAYRTAAMKSMEIQGNLDTSTANISTTLDEGWMDSVAVRASTTNNISTGSDEGWMDSAAVEASTTNNLLTGLDEAWIDPAAIGAAITDNLSTGLDEALVDPVAAGASITDNLSTDLDDSWIDQIIFGAFATNNSSTDLDEA